MLHRQLGQDRSHGRNPDVIADKVEVVEAGVSPAERRNAADTAATTEFSALNLSNLR